MVKKWVYIESERFTDENGITRTLQTVGHYDNAGNWQPESDHSDEAAAAARVNYLNGGPVQYVIGGRQLTPRESAIIAGLVLMVKKKAQPADVPDLLRDHTVEEVGPALVFSNSRRPDLEFSIRREEA